MMLSTVSWKDLAAGAGRVCAGTSCGKINDKTQSTMPARRRFLVFILVSREAAAHLCAFARLRETREMGKAFHAKTQRISEGAKKTQNLLTSAVRAAPPSYLNQLHRTCLPAGHALFKRGGVGLIRLSFGDGDVSRCEGFLFLPGRPQDVGPGGKVAKSLFDLDRLVDELQSFIPILVAGISVSHLQWQQFVIRIGGDQRVSPGPPDRLDVFYFDRKRNANFLQRRLAVAELSVTGSKKYVSHSSLSLALCSLVF